MKIILTLEEKQVKNSVLKDKINWFSFDVFNKHFKHNNDNPDSNILEQFYK